jgi:hypothetical protein
MELFFQIQVPFAFEFALGSVGRDLPTLNNEYLEADGIRFVLADEVGNTVA